MKKLSIIVPVLALLAILFFLISNNNQEKEIYLKDMFDRWDNGVLEGTEAKAVVDEFVSLLNENPKISNTNIKKISTRFNVYDKGNFRIIEYIENPEFYGSSARGSYHIVIYDEKAEIIDSNGSIQIYETIQLNEHLYYIYVTDYKFSNITGINIYSVTINHKDLKFRPIIAKDKLISGFKFIESLYYNNEHIYFENISNDGSEVLIKTNDTIYTLSLEEDGLYHFVD